MATLDLKSLTEEVIQKMGYTHHDLWLVKFDDEVFGPFEVESLKHYAHENEKLFLKAYSSRMDHNEWQPFFSHALFQPFAPNENPQSKRYWILNLGQKAGPFNKSELDKKIELGTLSMVDLISGDDGHSWKKLYQASEFHFNDNTVDNLPVSPLESSFQRAKHQVAEIFESRDELPASEGVAGLAFMTKKDGISLNIEDIDLKSLNQPHISPSLKWAIPSAVAGFSLIAFLGIQVMSGPHHEEVVINEAPIPVVKKSRTAAVIPAGAKKRKPSPYDVPVGAYQDRQPASYNRSPLTQPAPQENYYPTQVQSHTEADNLHDPAMDPEDPPPAPEEHSLVNNNVHHEGHEGQTLDQAMNDAANGEVVMPPPEPVIEEATDF
jgi:hypothetical protein